MTCWIFRDPPYCNLFSRSLSPIKALLRLPFVMTFLYIRSNSDDGRRNRRRASGGVVTDRNQMPGGSGETKGRPRLCGALAPSQCPRHLPRGSVLQIIESIIQYFRRIDRLFPVVLFSHTHGARQVTRSESESLRGARFYLPQFCSRALSHISET